MTGDKDRMAKRATRQQETLDRIGEHRRRHREALIDAGRAKPFVDKIHCGPGWIPIIVDFVTAADKHTDFVLIHASEKWGLLTLDYHVDPSATTVVSALAREAVDESSRTCETCGTDGRLRTEGWRKTLCDQHANDRRLVLTEEEHDALMEQFSASADRWRPILDRHRRDAISSDQLFESFLTEFEDLDTTVRRFWSMNLTRIILAGRDKDAG